MRKVFDFLREPRRSRRTAKALFTQAKVGFRKTCFAPPCRPGVQTGPWSASEKGKGKGKVKIKGFWHTEPRRTSEKGKSSVEPQHQGLLIRVSSDFLRGSV